MFYDWHQVWRQKRQWHPIPVVLPGKSHGLRSLVGCSPWDRYESDTTDQLHFHFSLSCIGGGNGNPLQCSCLENPRDGGAWWAAVYGVAPSRTWLTQLSSSSRFEGLEQKKQSGVLSMFFTLVKVLVDLLCLTLLPHGLLPSRLLCPWDSPSKNPGGIAIPFSRRSSWPRDQTWVFCIAGRFFTIWASRKPYVYVKMWLHFFFFQKLNLALFRIYSISGRKMKSFLEKSGYT